MLPQALVFVLGTGVQPEDSSSSFVNSSSLLLSAASLMLLIPRASYILFLHILTSGSHFVSHWALTSRFLHLLL